jgi:hypothetical protein
LSPLTTPFSIKDTRKRIKMGFGGMQRRPSRMRNLRRALLRIGAAGAFLGPSGVHSIYAVAGGGVPQALGFWSGGGILGFAAALRAVRAMGGIFGLAGLEDRVFVPAGPGGLDCGLFTRFSDRSYVIFGLWCVGTQGG